MSDVYEVHLTDLIEARRLRLHGDVYVGLLQPQERNMLLTALEATGGEVLHEQRACYKLYSTPPVLYWLVVKLGDMPCATPISATATPTPHYEAWPATPFAALTGGASEAGTETSLSSMRAGGSTSWLAAVFAWLKGAWHVFRR